MGFTLVENGTKGVNIGNPNILRSSGIFKVIYGLILAPVMGLFLAFVIYYPIYKFAVKSPNQSSWKCRVIYSLCVFVIMMAITFFFVVLNAIPPNGFNHMTFGVVIGGSVGIVFALAFLCVHNKLLAMTGQFQFSMSFIPNIINKFQNAVSRTADASAKQTPDQNDGSESMLDKISRGKDNRKRSIESEEGPSYSGDSTSILHEVKDDTIKSHDDNLSSSTKDNVTNFDDQYISNGMTNHVNTKTFDSTAVIISYGSLEDRSTGNNSSGSTLFNEPLSGSANETDEVKRVFQPLQFICACYAAINHGSNDVANCIGPLVTAWMLYNVSVFLFTSSIP